MAEDAKVLQDTTHSTLFGSNYAAWADEAAELITQYQQDAAGLNQQRIVSHEQLSDFLTVTGYADGTKVYVNYGSSACTENGITVPARGYAVERGQ